MAVRGQGHAPAASPREKSRVTHCTGGCVGPRASVAASGEEEMFTPAGFEHRDVQLVASRNINYAIPVLHYKSTCVGTYRVRQKNVYTL
jgi:hypothetical protein